MTAETSIEKAKRAIDQGDLYGMTAAAGHASIAVAEAIEYLGSRLQAQMPRVPDEDRPALALQMSEWWAHHGGATGDRMEYVLDSLLDTLGISR
ncbi:hypothetical protein CH296_00525 [Rhodococcus sp. 14-2496-1d]|uniref:hypothetical protein n=1 Tax=Rhodococcus sp. 14-2496-1d TaxID=2023146 RepID=UPI000B9A6718|nr:hypothetical protein [Rhodococcus sp. 14-2496-1d]OZF40775.1 hypothetical protein CH296_00525 [Rhodococcus sp. 14-2496-1d]